LLVAAMNVRGHLIHVAMRRDTTLSYSSDYGSRQVEVMLPLLSPNFHEAKPIYSILLLLEA